MAMLATANGTSVPLLNRNPTVRIGGQTAAIQFAGLAPGLVGLLQINIRIPAGLSGPLEIQVFIGDVESPTRPLVYVQ